MSHRVDPSELLTLQHKLENIRNFCILAHVDHGKTTLSDSLVSSNGIISSKLAGKLRFLDSTEEEQKRGITMHSSAIALLYKFEDKAETGGSTSSSTSEDYLINLVDSPGHIDFSSDVSTAARLCDGALIIVDVLEGVCTQTHAVIYKALKERMKPCLVLNKIDRLIVELRLTPTEAFHHLRRIIENVNALAFTLVNSEFLKINEEDIFNNIVAAAIPDDDPMVAEWTFSPEKGNVQFASALDGWGFGLMKFINFWHKKLGLNKNILRKYLFDDYAINMDTKKITKVEFADSTAQPMFATLVLNPLWKIYETLIINQEMNATLEYVKTEFEITLVNREINSRDLRSTLQSIMRKFLPLADSILRMVIRNMPNPRDAQKIRVKTLLNPEVIRSSSTGSSCSSNSSATVIESQLNNVMQGIETCANDVVAPLVVFISKMTPVRVAELSKRDIEMVNLHRLNRDGNADSELKHDQEIFMALGRVFSGVLTRRSELFVIGHKHDPLAFSASLTDTEMTSISLTGAVPDRCEGSVTRVSMEGDKIGCYLLLGPSVFPAESVPAGNIVGIIGLEDYILKSATLSDTWACSPLKAITFQAKPMLKVAVEPVYAKDLKSLEVGLQSLYQFDPVVEVGVDVNGQRTMTCLGELHLDQCVKALIERFAK